MKTFSGSISCNFRIVVPQQFLDALRRDAQSEGSTFLKVAQAAHPENDDAFLAMVLKNGLRTHLKANTIELLVNSGLGGTVSPAKIEIIEVPEDFEPSVAAVQTLNVRKALEAYQQQAEVGRAAPLLLGYDPTVVARTVVDADGNAAPDSVYDVTFKPGD